MVKINWRNLVKELSTEEAHRTYVYTKGDFVSFPFPKVVLKQKVLFLEIYIYARF